MTIGESIAFYHYTVAAHASLGSLWRLDKASCNLCLDLWRQRNEW